MKTASDIIDFLGRAEVAKTLGIKESAVRIRLSHNQLPASWYDTLEHMAGQPLPRDVFSFKGMKK